MTGLTEQELAEIEARANAATPRVGKTTGDVEFDRHSLDDVRRLLAEVRRLQSLWIFGEQGKYWTHPREQLCTSVDIGPHVHYGRNVILPVTEWSESVPGREPSQSG